MIFAVLRVSFQSYSVIFGRRHCDDGVGYTKPQFPSKDIQVRLRFALPDASLDEITVQTGQEAFRHRVVISIAHRTHARAHAHRLAALTKRQACVLAALIAVV